MVLDNYILNEGDPVRRLFMQIPCSSNKEANTNEAWHPTTKKESNIITLDILIKDENINILLGRPDWCNFAMADDIEVICSNLLMLMSACGHVKDRKNVQWFEIIHSYSPTHFRTLKFNHDDGIWLSGPVWEPISLEETPFYVEISHLSGETPNSGRVS